MSALEGPFSAGREARPLTQRKPAPDPVQSGLGVRVSRQVRSRLAGIGLSSLSVAFVVLLPLLILALLVRAWPLFAEVPLDNIFGTRWNPATGAFGLTPFIAGSLWVTVLSLALAIPLSLGSALYLSHYLRDWQRGRVRPLVELLAGIPSVVYGAWGVLVIVPAVRAVATALSLEQTTGYSVVSAALVLALMVTPFMIALMEEILRAVPRGMSEAALALGATRWEVVRDVLLRRARGGLIAAAGLGFARAFGETLAVLMVVGNVAKAPGSIFDPAYPLPALIANNFGEMMSVPLYDAALMSAALVLLVVVLTFNLGSRLLVQRLTLSDAH